MNLMDVKMQLVYGSFRKIKLAFLVSFFCLAIRVHISTWIFCFHNCMGNGYKRAERFFKALKLNQWDPKQQKNLMGKYHLVTKHSFFSSNNFLCFLSSLMSTVASSSMTSFKSKMITKTRASLLLPSHHQVFFLSSCRFSMMNSYFSRC